MNLEKAKDEFIKYTEKYDLKNERIEAKQKHSIRVMNVSKHIAEKLNLSQEDIDLATLIGLLHDIARFEQYTIFGTYKDIESIDHGDLGAEILRNDIRKYIETNEYDEIIIKAVKNHNKFAIEEGLTEKENLHSQIIRDADKIDIFAQGLVRFWKGNEAEVENSKLAEDIIQQIKKHSQIIRKKGETPIDNVISVIAFIFDLNFKSSFEIIKENDYINKILDRYNLKDEKTRKEVEEIRKVANAYVEQHTR